MRVQAHRVFVARRLCELYLWVVRVVLSPHLRELPEQDRPDLHRLLVHDGRFAPARSRVAFQHELIALDLGLLPGDGVFTAARANRVKLPRRFDSAVRPKLVVAIAEVIIVIAAILPFDDAGTLNSLGHSDTSSQRQEATFVSANHSSPAISAISIKPRRLRKSGCKGSRGLGLRLRKKSG